MHDHRHQSNVPWHWSVWYEIEKLLHQRLNVCTGRASEQWVKYLSKSFVSGNFLDLLHLALCLVQKQNYAILSSNQIQKQKQTWLAFFLPLDSLLSACSQLALSLLSFWLAVMINLVLVYENQSKFALKWSFWWWLEAWEMLAIKSHKQKNKTWKTTRVKMTSTRFEPDILQCP